MPTLEAIEHEITNILAVAEELDEGQPEVALEYLDQLAAEEFDKIDAISYAVRRRKAHIEWLKSEEARLRNRRQSMERRLGHFREYLKGLMLGRGLQNIRGRIGTIFLRRVESVHIEDETNLPEGYVETVVERRPRKADIKQALQAGAPVPGASLVENQSLTIR